MQNHKKDFKIYIIFALIFVTVFLGVLGGTAYYNVNSLYYVSTLPDSLKSNINILAAGIDDISSSVDAIVIATVNPEKNKITLTSVSPDTMTKVIDTNHPLKNIYSIGGTDMLVQKISDIFGIDIKYYICAGFSTFETVINTLGGVEFDVPYDMEYTDKKQNLNISLKKGRQTLGGADALKLIRYTKSKSDLSERDRIIRLFFEEVLNQKLNDKYISKIPSIAKEIIKSTQTNLLSYDTDAYIAIARSVMSKNIETHAVSGEYKEIDGYRFFIPDTDAAKNIFETKK